VNESLSKKLICLSLNNDLDEIVVSAKKEQFLFDESTYGSILILETWTFIE
jgi:hypothetical protein